MKKIRAVSLWLVPIVGCAAAASVGCGAATDATPGNGSAGMIAAAGAGVSGNAAGGAGAGNALGGASTSAAGAAPTAGAPNGGSGGAGGSTAGGSGGAASGSGGSAGGSSGSGGGSTVGAFGVTSCQPAFETACKPAIQFTNNDPNGKGKVFTNVIPDVETTMKDIACIACSILYRDPSEIPQGKKPTTVKLILDTHGGVAQTGGATIQFDLDYINGYANKSAAITLQEMLGVLQHETVHIYQNYGNGGVGEGMADLVRTRMGYYQRNRWTKGGSWKDAYTTSGFFFSWLTGPCSFHSETLPAHDLNLPYKLNKAIGNTSGDAAYTAVDNLLQQTFGRNADSLWTEYQNTAF